jgi:hypothetical protein
MRFFGESLVGVRPSEPQSGSESKPRSAPGRAKDACFDTNSDATRLAWQLLRLRRYEEYGSKMEMLIGPLLERNGGYSYDTFTLAGGLRSSFRYPRVEAARHDQRALAAETRREPGCTVHICETKGEFDQRVEVLRRVAASPAEAECAI